MIERVLLRDGVVDLHARRVWRSCATARLTGSEVEVLAVLARAAGESVDRQELLVRALGHQPDSLSRAVDLCVHRLRNKLEVDPSQPVHLMTVQGVGYRLVPAESLESIRTNVPPARGRLIGRDALLGQVEAALEGGPVALVGPAGVGKSRLARQIARRAASAWAPAGAWWVDVSECADVDEVARAIASALGVEVRGDSVLVGVARALRARGPTLLVLDTCERAPEAIVQAVAALATECWLLATSRVAVAEARAVEVPPLAAEDALALLAERAARPHLDSEGARRVVELVDRLPLGIELAAARLRALSLARIERELERPLRLLRQSGAPGRQASMEASIAWSWEALTPRQRDVLTGLAVFRGPIRAEATRGVLGPADVEVVDELVASHLLRAVPGGVAPWHAVREYAEVHGDPTVLAEARLRHASWMASWGDDLADALWGPDFARVLQELAALEPDLRAAFATSTRPQVTARLCRVLGELELELGRNAALVARTTAVLSRSPGDVPHRSTLWAQLSVAEGRRGRWLAAIDCGDEALACARTTFEEVEALHALGVALVRATRRARARAIIARAVEVAGDVPVLKARALGAVLLESFERRDQPFDPSIGRRALEAAVAAGCERLRGKALNNMGVALVRVGDLRSARPLFEEAIEVQRGGDARSLALAHQNLALLLFEDDPEAGLAHAERALEGYRAAGSIDGEVAGLALCGMFRALLGETTDAIGDLDEAIERNRETNRELSELSMRVTRAAALALGGGVAEARAELQSVGVEGVARALSLPEELAAALIAAWSGERSPPPELVSQLAASPGDRRWIHSLLLARRLRGPGGPSSPRPSGAGPGTR